MQKIQILMTTAMTILLTQSVQGAQPKYLEDDQTITQRIAREKMAAYPCCSVQECCLLTASIACCVTGACNDSLLCGGIGTISCILTLLRGNCSFREGVITNIEACGKIEQKEGVCVPMYWCTGRILYSLPWRPTEQPTTMKKD